MSNQSQGKPPFVIIKNFREKQKEESERKASLHLSNQEATVRKKRKMTLSSSKVQSPPPAPTLSVDNEEAVEQTKGEGGEQCEESYDDMKLEQGIPMEFKSNLRKQSLLDQSPPHSREYSPPKKPKQGLNEEEEMPF